MWVNKDGLPIKFGTELGHSTVDAGDYKTFNGAGESVLEFEIDLTVLTEVEAVINDAVHLAGGSQITWIETFAEAAASDGVAIDMGLIWNDRTTTTGVGPQVLLAAAPIANYNSAGETVKYFAGGTLPDSSVGTGAAIGTVLPGADVRRSFLVTASRTTDTAFTAGVLKVRIGYIPNALENVDGI